MKNNKDNISDASEIWEKRYEDGDLACTQEVVKSDPIDYTQHSFLYKQSIVKRVTGDPNGDVLLMVADAHLNPPVKKMLAVGSGLAFKEELLVKNGYVESLVAFESSSAAVKAAQERFRRSGLQSRIEMRTDDIMNANFQPESFDAVFVQAAIHHFYNIEEMFELFHKVLKPGGKILFDEYIGPDHHMYEPEVFDLMDEVNDCLAPSYRWDAMRKETRVEVPQATLEWMMNMDPSEGVHSSQILPLTYKYFDVVFRRDYGGTFMRPFFVGVLPNFDFNDEKDQSISRLIILMEELLIRYGVLPNYHTFVVGEKRVHPLEKLPDEDRINYSDWKGFDKYGPDIPMPKITKYSAANYSDNNWKNGIGLMNDTVFFLTASRRAIREFSVGRIIMLADGAKRSIVDVKQNEQSLVVTLSGDRLDPEAVGYPNLITLGD